MNDLLLSLHNDNQTYFSLLPCEICLVITGYFKYKVVGLTTNHDLINIYQLIRPLSNYRVIKHKTDVSFDCENIYYDADFCVRVECKDKSIIRFETTPLGYFRLLPFEAHFFRSDYEIHYIPP